MSAPPETAPPETAPPETGATARWVEVRLALACLLVAAAFARSWPNANEQRTLALLDALAERRLAIDPDAPGMVDLSYVPPAGVDRADLDAADVSAGAAPVTSGTRAGPGHYYSGGPPGLALTLAPADEVLRHVLGGPRRVWALTVLGAALPLALGAVAVRRALLAVGVAPAAATFAAAAHAFGTIALAFGARLYAHSLVVALLAGGLALLLGGATPRRCALAGLLGGWAVVADYNAGLQAAGLLALAALRGGPRGAAALALGALPPALLLAAYHAACFGGPLGLPYDFRADAATRRVVEVGAWGFTLPRPGLLAELLAGPRRGFLFTQPLALLGLAGLVAAARRDRVRALALAVVALTLLANAARVLDWDSGYSFGARYCAAALPFVALGLPRGLDLVPRRCRSPAVAAGLLAAGLGLVTDWGELDALTGAHALVWAGPRARGLELLVLGEATRELSAALAGAAATVALAPAAVWALARPAGAGERRARVATAVAAAAALVPCLHALPGVAREGTLPRQRVAAAELGRALAGAATAQEVRYWEGRAERRLVDPDLLGQVRERARARVRELSDGPP